MPLHLLLNGRERVKVFDLVGALNKDWQVLSTNIVLPRLFVERPKHSNAQAAVRRHHSVIGEKETYKEVCRMHVENMKPDTSKQRKWLHERRP